MLAKHLALPYTHAKMCSHTTHSAPVSGMHRYSVATAQSVVGTHASHMMVPVNLVNVPVPQVLHSERPVPPADMPIGHCWQAVAPWAAL